MSDDEMTLMIMFIIWEKKKSIIKDVLKRNPDSGKIEYAPLHEAIVNGIKKEIKYEGRPTGKRDSKERKARTPNKCKKVA
jgi:hypothetical protein